MGKKNYDNYKEPMSDIAEAIFNEYVEELRERNTPNVLNDVGLLRDNNLAIVINENSFMYSEEPNLCRVGSKFMRKHNSELKDFKRKLGVYEFGGENGSQADANPKLIKLARGILDIGTYYAQLDASNFAILDISCKDEDAYYMYTTKMVFVGDDNKTWKRRFDKMRDKYDKIYRSQVHEFISAIPSMSTQPAMFKAFDSVVFKEKDKVLKYVDNWVKNVPEYYNKYKMIPKLSVILYGDPGTGKSTFGKALAKYLKIGRVVNVEPNYFLDYERDERHNPFDRFRQYGNGFVISLDDIDCYCDNRENQKEKSDNSVMASLLSFLDNPPTTTIKCADGLTYPVSIVVASTNYFDRLDDAVKRYGRFDLRIHMPVFEKPEAQEMCDLYGLKLEDLVEGSNKKGFTISPSELQAKCLENVDKNLKQSE